MPNRDLQEILEQILEECQKINNICRNYEQQRKSIASPSNDIPKKHYVVKFLKMQPDKVLINGDLKDRHNLSHAEREAVKTQKEIDKARAQLRQQRMEIMKKNLGLN